MTEEAQAGDLLIEPAPQSRSKRILKWLVWAYAGFMFLVFFTFLKLPEDRIKNFMLGNVTSALAMRGISMTTGKSDLSFIFGLTYTLYDVSLNFPDADSPVHFDRIRVSPSVFQLLLRRIGGSVDVREGKGDLSGNFWFKNPSLSVKADVSSFDLGHNGLLKALAGVNVNGKLDGSASITADVTNYATSAVDLNLSLAKVVVAPLSIQGFSIPQINLSEGKIEVATEKGKLVIRKFQLGKNGVATDDIHATLTGDVLLGKQLQSTTLNVKAGFSLSPAIFHSIPGLDTVFLAPGKQSDGSFAYQLSGPIMALNPTPLPGGIK